MIVVDQSVRSRSSTTLCYFPSEQGAPHSITFAQEGDAGLLASLYSNVNRCVACRFLRNGARTDLQINANTLWRIIVHFAFIRSVCSFTNDDLGLFFERSTIALNEANWFFEGFVNGLAKHIPEKRTHHAPRSHRK